MPHPHPAPAPTLSHTRAATEPCTPRTHPSPISALPPPNQERRCPRCCCILEESGLRVATTNRGSHGGRGSADPERTAGLHVAAPEGGSHGGSWSADPAREALIYRVEDLKAKLEQKNHLVHGMWTAGKGAYLIYHMGKLKQHIQPSDITINIIKRAPPPEFKATQIMQFFQSQLGRISWVFNKGIYIA